MTNEEAINLISRNKSVFQYDTEMTKALDLAIKALEEKPFEINVFLENADESTLFDIKKELARILTDRAEREAYEEARREAMRLDDNEDTYKWRGHA